MRFSLLPVVRSGWYHDLSADNPTLKYRLERRSVMITETKNTGPGHWRLYLIVSMSGAAVLAVELLGTRVLGPFYGVSLFLWSALISVTLAALSAGYAIGGGWADRSASFSSLGAVMGTAGLWLLVVPWLRGFVLRVTEPVGLRIAVLAAATILFFPPLMLLGMVSPIAVKLRARTLTEVGRSAGNLYAVSTVASVAAALLTGFVLIPAVGISTLLHAIGALLLLAAAFAIFSHRGRSKAASAAAILLIVLGALLPLMGAAENRGASVIATCESPYAEIRVMEYLDARFLIIDGSIHTFVDAASCKNLFPYVHVVDIAGMFYDEPGRLCLLGLGGGSIARRYSQAGWHVDAVEIDPVVVRFAHDYFELEPSDTRIFEMDGRRFLREIEETYDIIVFDAFGGGNIPFQLVTAEAFDMAASRLRPDGIIVLNIESIGWKDEIVRSIAATLETRFEHILALPIAEPPNTLGNVILFASDREFVLPRELPDPEYRISPEYDRVHAWDNRFEPETDGMACITDDRNPVALWGEKINYRARKQLHAYFGDADVRW
jgi:spermidine synthase